MPDTHGREDRGLCSEQRARRGASRDFAKLPGRLSLGENEVGSRSEVFQSEIDVRILRAGLVSKDDNRAGEFSMLDLLDRILDLAELKEAVADEVRSCVEIGGPIVDVDGVEGEDVVIANDQAGDLEVVGRQVCDHPWIEKL